MVGRELSVLLKIAGCATPEECRSAASRVISVESEQVKCATQQMC